MVLEVFSELVVMHIVVEMSEGLRYKLQMMGIPVDGLVIAFCKDINSAILNCSVPESHNNNCKSSYCLMVDREGRPFVYHLFASIQFQRAS